MSDNANIEEPKRLNPTSDVLRRLFLNSGNLCAFPGCSRPIMNKDGIMVGQICHIEAAEKGGERFNEKQSNEERRAFSNLLLLCYDHHQETNDVEKFSVKRMQEIKSAHERKVFDFIEKTLLEVTDQTKLNNPHSAKNLGRLSKLLNWKLNDAEIADSAKTANEILTRLSRLPMAARQLLLVMIERAHGNMVLSREVQLACSLSDSQMSQLCGILDKRGFIDDGGEDDFGNARICLSEFDGWDLWSDFRAVVETGHASWKELIIDLNFSLLDA